MKANVKVLDDFLSKIIIGGTVSVNQTVLDFEEKDITGTLRNEYNTISMRVNLKTSLFEDYENVGEIGIMDLGLLRKMLKRHSGTVDLKFTKDKLNIKDSSNLSKMILPETKFIKKVDKFPEVEKVEWEEVFDIDADSFKKFISDMSIIEKSEINIETKKNGLVLSSGDMDSITSLIKNQMIKGGCKVSFNEVFMETIKIFNGGDVLKVHLKSDFPAYIILQNDLYSIEYIITPIDNEE